MANRPQTVFKAKNEANEEIKSRVQVLTVINLDLIQLRGF